MKENNYRDREDVKLIANQIWKSINILRGILPVEQHHIYLFLLSAYYDGLIKKDFLEWGNDYEGFIYRALEEDYRYRELLNIYFPIINSIPEDALRHLIYELSRIDKDIPEFIFNAIFDNLLFKLASNQGKYSGEFLLPNEISSFAMALVDIPTNAKVFNPFAGLASFATHLNNKESYCGQEIIESTWALGMLRLIRKRSNIDIDYRIEDSIKKWPNYNKFDLIVSNPPLSFKINSNDIQSHFAHNIEEIDSSPKFNLPEFSRISTVQYVIQKGLESINIDGQVVCVATQRFLFRGGHEKIFREYLIEEGLIDTVISLPGGLLKNTGTAICILVLTKKRNYDRTIRLVDGTNFIIENGRRDKRLDNEKLLNYLKFNNNLEFVRQIPIDDFRKNDYNLSVQRYFLKEFDGIILKELVKPVKGIRSEKDGYGKFIRSSNLKDDDVDYILDVNMIKDRELKIHSKKIEHSCILVSTRWKSLKPTLFEYSGVPIYLGIDIIALAIDNQELDHDYLISELRSTKVIEQVASYQNTGAVQSINRSDFYNIKINVPSIQEQKAKVKGILELAEKFKSLQKERNALAHGQKLKSFDEFASLKHSLGAPRQNILSNAKSLIRFFESNNSEGVNEVKDKYLNRYDTNLIDDLVQIKDDINHISTILEQGEKGLVLDNFELMPVSIKDINKELKTTKKSNEKFTIKYEELSNTELTGKKAVKVNMTLFKILIDNILSNAEKYAFTKASENNEVIIELKVSEDFMYLEIKNNGISFPKNYDKKKFSSKFSTANPDKGTGLGGYDINRIAEYFNNPEWRLILNNEVPFPVSFKFNFPIIPMINE